MHVHENRKSRWSVRQSVFLGRSWVQISSPNAAHVRSFVVFLIHTSKDRDSKSKGEDILKHHENPWRVGKYRYATHNDVSVNDGQHIRRWSHNIIINYNIIL